MSFANCSKVWFSQLLLSCVCLILIGPAFALFVVSFSFVELGDGIFVFLAMMLNTFWLFWVVLMYIVPTMGAIGEYADGVAQRGERLSFGKLILLVFQGVLWTIPFRDGQEDKNANR